MSEKKRNSGFITIFIWLFAIVIGVLIGSTFSDKLPESIRNEKIETLNKDNKLLEDKIKSRKKIIKENKKLILDLNEKNLIVTNDIRNRDSLITNMISEIDSINRIITNQDTIIIKIYEEQYKDINRVNDMDFNERILFFKKYFRKRL